MATSVTLTKVPLHLTEDSEHNADKFGLVHRDHVGEGVTSSTGLVVSENSGGANMTVDVAAGRAWVAGDDDTESQPIYHCHSTGVVDLDVAAADVTNDRIDLVVLEVLDSAFTGASELGRIRIITGTPAATPARPTLPDTALPLALVNVTANASSVTDADIDDMRQPSSADLSRVGMIEWFPLAEGSAPWGYAIADGTALDRLRYSRLFGVYGTTVGTGDGSTTFDVPNIENRSPIGAGGTYSVRATGGATTHTLSSAEMPSHTHTGPNHTHTFSDSFTTSNNGIPSINIATAGGGAQCGYGVGGTFARSSTAITDQNADPIFTQNGGGSHAHSGSVSGTTSAAGTGNTGSTGSGSAHNNLHPYYALTPVIRV